MKQSVLSIAVIKSSILIKQYYYYGYTICILYKYKRAQLYTLMFYDQLSETI